MGVASQTVREWRIGASLPAQSSKDAKFLYVNPVAQKLIEEAADLGLGLHEAAKYARISHSKLLTIWKRMRYDYFTSEQSTDIIRMVEEGLPRNRILRGTGITQAEFQYFLDLIDLKYTPQPYTANRPKHGKNQTKRITSRPRRVNRKPREMRSYRELIPVLDHVREIMDQTGIPVSSGDYSDSYDLELSTASRRLWKSLCERSSKKEQIQQQIPIRS